MVNKDIVKEIEQIRSLMEKSSKFMSISGLSGVLVGSYALIGAFIAKMLLIDYSSSYDYDSNELIDDGLVLQLILIASIVLLASVLTGIIMAKKKARHLGQGIWNAASQSLAKAMLVPLATGGFFSLILVAKSEFSLVASTLLIFYGLSLYAAGAFSFKELRWLGILEIVLGLLALGFTRYGLWFWGLGFGVLHIIYGLIVHQRYEK